MILSLILIGVGSVLVSGSFFPLFFIRFALTEKAYKDKIKCVEFVLINIMSESSSWLLMAVYLFFFWCALLCIGHSYIQKSDQVASNKKDKVYGILIKFH